MIVVLGLALLEVVLAWVFAHHTGVPTEQETEAPVRNPARVWTLRILPWALFAVLLTVGAVLVHDAVTNDFLGFLPESMRRGVEHFLKVPAPSPGEKMTWHLEYRPQFWDEALYPWVAGGIAVAALAMLIFVYRQERGRAGIRDRFLLGGLRLALIAALLAVVLPQLRLMFYRQECANIVVLIDDSASMSATERYGDPNDRAAADKLAEEADRMARAKTALADRKDEEAKQREKAGGAASGDERGRLTKDIAALRDQAKELRQEAAALDTVRGGGDMQRLQLVCALMTRDDGRWLATLLSRRDFKVHIYHCSNQTGASPA